MTAHVFQIECILGCLTRHGANRRVELCPCALGTSPLRRSQGRLQSVQQVLLTSACLQTWRTPKSWQARGACFCCLKLRRRATCIAANAAPRRVAKLFPTVCRIGITSKLAVRLDSEERLLTAMHATHNVQGEA